MTQPEFIKFEVKIPKMRRSTLEYNRAQAKRAKLSMGAYVAQLMAEKEAKDAEQERQKRRELVASLKQMRAEMYAKHGSSPYTGKDYLNMDYAEMDAKSDPEELKRRYEIYKRNPEELLRD